MEINKITYNWNDASTSLAERKVADKPLISFTQEVKLHSLKPKFLYELELEDEEKGLEFCL